MTSEQSRSDLFELGCEAGEKMKKWSVHTFVLVFADVYESGGMNHLGSKIVYHFAGALPWCTLLLFVVLSGGGEMKRYGNSLSICTISREGQISRDLD